MMNNVLYDNAVLARQVPRRPRVYRHRPLQLLDTYTDEEIRDRYHFRQDSIGQICQIVGDNLERPNTRNKALSVEIQVLAALRFIASGCFFQFKFFKNLPTPPSY